MNTNLSDITQNFNMIYNTRNRIDKKNIKIKKRLETLHQLYRELVSNNKSKLALFGLDTFFFQNELIRNDQKNIDRDYKLMNNRIYCDYYKLNKIIISYVNNDIQCKKISYEKIFRALLEKKFQKYSDIDPFKDYEFKSVNHVFKNIIALIKGLKKLHQQNTQENNLYSLQKESGICIHNFVSTLKHQNLLIAKQIELFINYVNFFIGLHTKYYDRLLHKLSYMKNQMNVDIKFNGVCDEEDKEENDSDNDDLEILMKSLPPNIQLMSKMTPKNIKISKKNVTENKNDNGEVDIDIDGPKDDVEESDIVEKLNSDDDNKLDINIEN